MKLTWQQQDAILVNPRGRFKLTPAELAEGRKFRAFCRTALGIDIHVGQVAFAATVLVRHPAHPDIAHFMTLMLSSGNRAGKTSTVAMLIIYSCLTKLNLKPLREDATDADKQRWARMEYHWYHFGISQEVADLVYNDIVRILSGTHLGQEDRGCPMAEGRIVAITDGKEYGDYRWVRFTAEFGGAQVHFRTTGEKALGQLGKDMNGISFDEAGIEKNLIFLIKEVFDFRRLGTGGQLIMASTPSEDLGHDFADQWELGNPANRDRKASWNSMRMSTRDNIGYGLTQLMFDILTKDMDDRTIRQNVEGEFLQAKAAYFNGENVESVFMAGLPERIKAQRNGTYLQGVDPSKSTDSAWAMVLKVVPNIDEPEKPFLVGVRAEEKPGQKSTETVVGMCYDGWRAYENNLLNTRCYTATDATGFGGKMFRERLDEEVPNVTNVEFGGTAQKKRKLLGDLRTLIDEGRLILPRTGIWLKVRRQLLGYKLEDRGIEQDAVMALVCAVHLLRRTPIDGVKVVPFDITGSNAFALSDIGDEDYGPRALAQARMRARL